MRYLLFLLCWLPLFGKEIIAVSILPQKFIVDRIVSNHFETIALLPPGASPATFAPKPSIIAKLKEARLYFSVGVPFEKALLERSDIHPIDIGRYLRRFGLEADHHHDEGLDPHIWLAPPYVMLMARVVMEEVCRIDATHCQTYLNNYQKFLEELAAFDSRIFAKLSGLKKRTFLVYHPSFGYFAKVYRLRQIAIEKEGKEPKPKNLIKLIQLARQEGLSTIIIEPQFPKKSAQFLAKKIGAKVEVIDPLAYDIFSTIQKVADAVSSN